MKIAGILNSDNYMEFSLRVSFTDDKNRGYIGIVMGMAHALVSLVIETVEP